MSASARSTDPTPLRMGADICEIGPIPVSRNDQVSRQFHRLRSVKGGLRTVICVGQLAADAVVMAEGDPSIVGLRDRSLRVHGPIGTRPHMTFDLSVTYHNGRTVHLMTHREGNLLLAEDGRHLPRDWAEIERRAVACGHEIAILTDVEIERHRQRIRNWRLLLPFVLQAHEHPHPGVADDIQDLIRERRDVTLDELTRLLVTAVAPHAIPALARLLHEGVCDAQLDASEFTRATPIRLRNSQ